MAVLVMGLVAKLADLFSRRPSRRAALGARGERLAAKHLKAKGFTVIGRNLRTDAGEVDILCLDPDRHTVVVVEVKTRTLREGEESPFLPPEASVTAQKRRTLIRLAHDLACANGWTGRPIRIDVVAVEWPEGREPTVRHHPGAVNRSRVTTSR